MRGKKGLSTVVTTLIIVLLVLAAIGIIWNPIKKLLTESTASFDQTKCLNFGLTAKKVIKYNATGFDGVYNVTLTRSASGADEQIGARLILFAGDTASNVHNIAAGTSGLSPLAVKTFVVNTTEDGDSVVGAGKIQVTPTYLDTDSGKEVLCPQSTDFEFTA